MKSDKDSPDGKTDRPAQDVVKNDVDGFFRWANLEGSKYRDYSESRDKSRAVARQRNEMERGREEEPATPSSPAADDGKTGPPRVAPPGRVTGQRKLATMPGGGRSAAQRPQARPTQRPSSRWAALQSPVVAEEGTPQNEALQQAQPAIAFFSLAGGTGKTSVAAATGCLLAADGTRSLLVDTHVYGLLPLFFGARELQPGSSRTFAASDGVALRVLSLKTPQHQDEESAAEQIAHHAEGMDRVLIDVSTGSIELLRDVLPLLPTVVVVLAPDMASVVSLLPIQRAIEEMEEERGMEIPTFFLLNQFEGSLRLHRDVRERLTRQLGRRLLPFAVRRSYAVVEALAAGMTVVDYALDSPVVEDLMSLSQWIHELDEPGLAEIQDVRWRQR